MDHTSAVEVGPAHEDDWTTLRSVRLAALADSPSAFGSTTAREEAFDEERWRSWGRSGRVFLATVDGGAVGIAAGNLEAGRADVVSMWVDPAVRGGQAASRLLLAVVGWARRTGVPEVGLTVMADNVHAQVFYERHGFVRVTTQTARTLAAPDAHRMVSTFVR